MYVFTCSHLPLLVPLLDFCIDAPEHFVLTLLSHPRLKNRYKTPKICRKQDCGGGKGDRENGREKEGWRERKREEEREEERGRERERERERERKRERERERERESVCVC
jgi:hypothetical protein